MALEGRSGSTESIDSVLRSLAETPEGLLARGTLVSDRFSVERVLGEGGMGVVYLARDLPLDRLVALKVGTERSSSGLGRLSREALALARLSHPNVVVVHQVGDIGGRLYIAMEYVAGGTARRWRTSRDRTWREIVALYAAAGDGLAAAHATGIVHRDFKPDNVLVGQDGRPRVADFGLARVLEQGPADVPASERTALDRSRVSSVVGTLAYMAPEQIEGGLVDARSDQFGLCASLWEALFGRRPFAGDGPEALLAAIRMERPERAPRAEEVADVPRHVEAALRRGLRARAEERWPSLEPLLAELRRDPSRTRARWLGLGLVGAAALVVWGTSLRSRAPDPCARAAVPLSDAWSADVRTRLRGALTADGAPWRTAAAVAVVSRLDAWAVRFSSQSRSVCEAGLGTWSSSLRDRGVECLARRKRQLGAVVDVLTAEAPGALDRSEAVLGELGAPERCSDVAFLGAAVPPPDDPARAEQVLREDGELARSLSLTEAGQTREARTVADGVLQRSAALAYPPLEARARWARGYAGLAEHDVHAFDDLHSAYFLAHAHRDHGTAASIAGAAALALLDQSRDAEAPDWAELARADATLAADPLAESRALHALARVSAARGESTQGLDYAERFVATARRLEDADLVGALRARAEIRLDLGESNGALADLDEAEGELRHRRGDEHPTMSTLEYQRCRVLATLDRHDEAIAACEHALAIAETSQGPDGRLASNAVAGLVTALQRAGRLEQALAASERALASSRRLDGPESFNAASDMNNRADVLQLLGRVDEAVELFRAASQIYERIDGPDSRGVGSCQLNIANALLGAWRLDGVRGPAERAAAIFRGVPRSSGYAESLVALGVAQAHDRSFGQAEATLREALERLQALEDVVDAPWHGQAELAMAECLVARGDLLAARPFATRALDRFPPTGEGSRRTLRLLRRLGRG